MRPIKLIFSFSPHRFQFGHRLPGRLRPLHDLTAALCQALLQGEAFICSLHVSCLILANPCLYRQISLLLSLFLCSMSLLVTANVKSITEGRIGGGSGGGGGGSSSAIDNDISPAGLYCIYLSIILVRRFMQIL